VTVVFAFAVVLLLVLPILLVATITALTPKVITATAEFRGKGKKQL